MLGCPVSVSKKGAARDVGGLEIDKMPLERSADWASKGGSVISLEETQQKAEDKCKLEGQT